MMKRSLPLVMLCVAGVSGCNLVAPNDNEEPAVAEQESENEATTTGQQRAFAFRLGQLYGHAGVMVELDNEDVAKGNIDKCRVFAQALDIEEPTVPAQGEGFRVLASGIDSMAEDIRKRHGDRVSASARLGVALAELALVVTLEKDPSKVLAKIAKEAEAAHVPERFWKERVAAVSTESSMATVKALDAGLEKHFGSLVKTAAQS